MSYPKPTITVSVDVTNPGQFFACCGLLELADRLVGGVEGWFQGGEFHVSCGCGVDQVLAAIALAELRSSLSPDELQRLGTLLSKEKATLTQLEHTEKSRLQEKWRLERLWLSAPFSLWLDWWRDTRGERTSLKTWAAKQLVAAMAGRMYVVFREWLSSRSSGTPDLFFVTDDDSLPFNFDSDLCATGAARDAGFSADTLGLKCAYRPLLELLAFVAFQRFHPYEATNGFIYCPWRVPLSPCVAAVAASGAIADAAELRYSFTLFNRTKYMKAFLPAHPIQGV